MIEIGPDRITKLMEVFQGDFHHLANHLKLMNERMVLVNPKFHGLTTAKRRAFLESCPQQADSRMGL